MLKEPANKNFFDGSRFKFYFTKLPTINFFVQSANIPSITLGKAIQPTIFLEIPVPGDKLNYGVLNVSFKVDEEFKSWNELNTWLTGLGKPNNFNQYKELYEGTTVFNTFFRNKEKNIYSDAILQLCTSNFNPKYDILFIDCFPISLSELQLNSTDTDTNYLTCNASFAYSYYLFKKL